MDMDYTFVQQHNGESPRRKRLAKACETCRSRKKRCCHNQDNEPSIEASEPHATPFGGPESSTPQDTDGTEQDHFRGISASVREDSVPQRFLSDLHPETRLLERTPTDAESRRAKPTDSIGVWVNKQEWEALVGQRDAAIDAGGRSDRPARELEPPSLIRPHSAQLAGLIDVFFEKIHPFLPLIDETEFRRAHAGSLVPEPFVHALCLAAAKDSAAEGHLRLSESSEPSPPRELCRAFHASVKAAVGTPVKFDKVTLVRMLALLSIHNEGPDGAEEASLWLAQAMHHSQTLGLHLSASFPPRDCKNMKLLFWCLWALDRLNAATNGRPIIMADNDIAIELFSPGESGFPAFEILVKIARVMNEVIAFYRPGNTPTVTGWEENFPGFDEIVDEMNGWPLPPGTLSTLHIAYLTAAILSHRSKGAKEFANTTPSHVRQSLAAIQIIRLMNPGRLGSLHALPILPYAISLALSVSYQHLRQDQLKHQQEDARADFEACFVILRELRRIWSSADVMTTLSEKVLEELRRAPNITSFRIQRPARAQKLVEDLASACRHDGEALGFSRDQETVRPIPTADREFIIPGMQQTHAPEEPGQSVGEAPQVGQNLFEGMDDIFGTYLDPNYPVSLDFLDDFAAGDGVEGL